MEPERAAVERDRARRARRRARSRSSNDRTTAWLAAKILLAAAAVALAVAAYLAWRPVENPGVQDCGSPLGFYLTDRENVTVSIGIVGAPENAVELAEQPTCRDLAEVAIRKAGIAAAAGFALALVGALIGLIDDRVAYWRAPRFESLLRPMDRAQRIEFGLIPNVDVDELGGALPPIERPEVAGLVAFGVVASVGLVVAGTTDAVRSVAAGLEVTPVLVGAALAAAAYLGAAAQRVAVFDGRSSPPRILELTVATSWSGTLRPLVGAFGIDVHHLRRRGVGRDAAVERVQAIESVSALVHVVLLVAATLVAREVARPYVALDVAEWVLVSLLGLTLLVGLTRVPRRWQAAPVKPGRAALRGLRDLGRAPARLALLLAGTLGLLAARVGVLAACVAAVGVELDGAVVVWLALAVVVVGLVAPTPNGAGVVEVALALGLAYAGVALAAAAVIAIAYRVLTLWLPLLPAWRASRSLHRAGDL